MPLSKIELNNSGGWALWLITETEAELEAMVSDVNCDIHSTYHTKKLEWLASRMLIEKLAQELHLPFAGMTKDEFGKPFLKDSQAQLSLSHSYPYAAVQINLFHAVGIDIEKPSLKINRVAHRVFSAHERADAGDILEKTCIYWCAKEALYKLYGKRGLSYVENLVIEPFTLQTTGELNSAISTGNFNQHVLLNYHVEKDIVVVNTKNVIKK